MEFLATDELTLWIYRHFSNKLNTTVRKQLRKCRKNLEKEHQVHLKISGIISSQTEFYKKGMSATSKG